MSDYTKAVREADEETERAMIALTLGKFPEYFEAYYDGILKQLNDRFNVLSAGPEQPVPGGHGSPPSG